MQGVPENGWGEEGAGNERAGLRGRRVCKGVAGEKKALGMSELADGCGRRGCNGVAGNGWGEQAWKMVSAGYVRI